MRRLALAAVLAALCGCMDIGSITTAIGDARAVAKIGVVAHPEVSWPKSTARLERALSFYKSKKVDAIVVLGDLTKEGYLNQYRVLAQAWDKVFRNPAKGIDPNPPRRIFVLGLRDRESFRPEFGQELGDDLSLEGGEFDVNGFRFRAVCGRPEIGSTPVFFSDGKPALTDELCWYPRTRVEINAGSLSGIVPKAGYEPARLDSASQGLLVTAYSGDVVVSRIDFGDKESVAEDWRFARSGEGSGGRMDERAPEFWDDTELRVFKGEEPKKGVFYKVVWPPVLAKYTGMRAHSYEVEAVMRTADGEREVVVLRRYVLSPNFHRSESRDASPVSCRFYASELPQGANVRFRVTPVSSFGVRGRSISN